MKLDYFRMFARYNQWANQRLYAASATLPEAEYLKPRAAFFGSLHATLNHILVGDRVWMGRITGRPTADIRALNQILYAELAGLRVARAAEDAQIVNMTEAMDEPTLNSTLRYKNMTGESQQTPMRFVLAHVFNHQTHHRGQAHALLSQAGAKPPPLDLIYYLRELAPPPD